MGWHRTEVDGVPAYWAEGDEDQRRVLLAFRVGIADEQLAWRGITHLVEHLTMHAAGGHVHDSNLRIDLPEGERIPPPEPSSALPRTPAYFRQPDGIVAMTSLVRRSTAAQVYVGLLGARLHPQPATGGRH